MDNPQFNVVVDGSVLDGFDAAAVLRQLQQQLKLAEDKAQLLIAGRAVTVKRNVDAAIAGAYCKRLQTLGINARVEATAVSAADTVPTADTVPAADTAPAPAADPAETARPASAPPSRRYFSAASLAASECANTSVLRRALMRATIALGTTLLAYCAVTLIALGLLLFYLVHYAGFLAVPPILFSAAVYFSVSLMLAAIAALLLRPLLAQAPDADEALLLSPLQEPALFAFVAELCEKLALTSPAQIALTAATNNSAALLPTIKNLQRGEYRLTLSLPALENSALHQFAALLAADLATQATLPMLRYRWLARHTRTRIDTCLDSRDWLTRRIETAAQIAPAKLSRVFAFARKLIEFANRGLEKFSARIAHIDAAMQRPLLHEQDRYAALVAGSSRFTELMVFRARLDIAARGANAKNREDRIEGGLVDDLPALIRHYFEGIEENFVSTVQRQWQAETTPRRDEAPIMRERIELIATTVQPGLIDDGQPALPLLQQRDERARAVTLASYREANLDVEPASLLPTDELTYAATQDMLQRQQAAIYFNDWFKPFRFWSLADYQLIRDMPLQDAAAQLSVCVNEIRRLTPDRAKLLAEFERLQNQLRELLLAQHVLAAGKRFSFRYVQCDGTTLAPLLEERQNTIADIMGKLAQQEAVMGGRITLGLRLSGQAEREVHELHDALRLLHDIGARLHKLSLDCFQLEQLLQRQYELREADYSLAIKKLETRIDDACTLLIARLNDIPYPLDSRHRSLKSFVEALPAQPATQQRSPILQRAQRLLDVLYRVNEKFSRQAADYGTIAEEAYRIEPIRLIRGE